MKTVVRMPLCDSDPVHTLSVDFEYGVKVVRLGVVFILHWLGKNVNANSN